MTDFEPGMVILVHFPFTDLSSSKKRPALILSPPDYPRRFGDVVLMPLTSQPQPEAHLALAGWRSAGLPKPTWIKPLIATLSVSLLDRTLGKLTLADYKCVRSALSLALAPFTG